MTIKDRVAQFCETYSLDVPIMMAPMAGACPVELAAAVARGGGMGACGALLMEPNAIIKWASELRSKTNGSFQMNLWIPDPAPNRDLQAEAEVRAFLRQWGPEVPEDAANVPMPDFEAQCDALLAAGPTVVSSIMGLYPPAFVEKMKERGIRWFATVTTVEEAIAAQAAGADVIVAQGFEAGGHRGAFHAEDAVHKAVGLFSLLPAVVDNVSVPVVATGGIADGRGIAAALTLGASAVQMGTGFLLTPEAALNSQWADGLQNAKPEDTCVTRAFSGRAGRSLASDYVVAMNDASAPLPAPYPIQRNLTS
ncbi:MAG: nitronate monooxygenase, partial [Marinomonas sp.]